MKVRVKIRELLNMQLGERKTFLGENVTAHVTYIGRYDCGVRVYFVHKVYRTCIATYRSKHLLFFNENTRTLSVLDIPSFVLQPSLGKILEKLKHSICGC